MPVHFFVGHELGHAVADGVAAVLGELDFAAGGQVDQPQVAFTHEAHVGAARRHLRVGGEAGARGELAHRVGDIVAQVVQIKFAAQREQQRLRGRRPLVVNDAAEGRDALAFAPRLFFVRQGFLARQHDLGIHQPAGFAAGDVIFPQVQLEAVVVLATQESDARTVGRDRRLHQAGARQRLVAGDGFQRQLVGVGSGGKGHGGGEQQASDHRVGLRRGSRHRPAARRRSDRTRRGRQGTARRARSRPAAPCAPAGSGAASCP